MGKKEKKAKKECDYFEMMVRGVKFSCKAAELLKTNLENFDPNTLQARMEEMHVIEHNADISKHDTCLLYTSRYLPFGTVDIGLVVCSL